MRTQNQTLATCICGKTHRPTTACAVAERHAAAVERGAELLKAIRPARAARKAAP